MRNVLTMERLQQIAPSMFATAGAGYVSENYKHIATAEVVKGLMGEGFMPTLCTQQKVRTRAEEREGFQKHMLRFTHQQYLDKTGVEHYPEVVLVNSHDRSCAYHLYFGIFRLVCENGLIIMSQGLEHLTVRHQGTIVDNVIEASYKLIGNAPIIQNKIAQFKDTFITQDGALSYATEAMKLKWKDNLEHMEMEPAQLLRARHNEDMKGNLWTVYNVVQENIFKGGLSYTVKAENLMIRNATSKGVNGINETISLNQKLWALTEKYAEVA